MRFPRVTLWCLALFWICPNEGRSQPEWLIPFVTQEKALSEELVVTPNAIPLLSKRGDFRLFLGEFAGAVTDYEKMIQVRPAEDAPHWRLGIAYYFAGQFSKSARQFEKYHAYDGHDRENGVWKWMAQARADGLEAAKQNMLIYREFDREPFPSLYEMFAGKRTAQSVLEEVSAKGLGENKQVLFFSKYYAGVYLTFTGQKPAGVALIKQAVELFSPLSAGREGPGYMWQVARVHLDLLEKEEPSEKPH